MKDESPLLFGREMIQLQLSQNRLQPMLKKPCTQETKVLLRYKETSSRQQNR